MNVAFVIVAGGKGTRMGADRPKQYLELDEKPVLIETVANVAYQLQNDDDVVVVVPPGDLDFVRMLIREFFVHRARSPRIQVTGGGETRAESVRKGLDAVPGRAEFVAVHDGVRPFVNASLISRLLGAAGAGARSVIPALPADDSIRLREGKIFRSVPRRDVFRVQTPQLFEASLLRTAYRRYAECPDPALTDDASIVSELCGVAPTIVEGLRENIKITTPTDLRLAQLIAEDFDPAG